MGRRGQAAFEYLMSYAWAILVVMLVGVSFYLMGALSGDGANSADTSVGFTFFKLLSAASQSQDGIAVMVFQNTYPGAVNLNLSQSTIVNKNTGTRCTFFNSTVYTDYSSAHTKSNIIFPQNVPPNGQFRILSACDASVNDDEYEFEVNLVYHTIISGQLVTKGERGIVHGKYSHTSGNTYCSSPFALDNHTKGMTCYDGQCVTDICATPNVLSKWCCNKGAGVCGTTGPDPSTVATGIGCKCVDGACV